jgi:hypothetical protein
MYKREKLEYAEYKMIMNDSNGIFIPLVSLRDATSLKEAVTNYYSIEDYLEHIYEKDNTTKYKPRKKGTRLLEFVEDVDEVAVLGEQQGQQGQQEPVKKTLREMDTKIIKINKVKKMKPMLILEEDVLEEPLPLPSKEVIQNIDKEETFDIENIVGPIADTKAKENAKAIAKVKTKTKSVREKAMKVNPQTKNKTMKNKPTFEFDVIED